MRKMRRISGSFWTLERDERLRRLEAEGLSAAKIAKRCAPASWCTTRPRSTASRRRRDRRAARVPRHDRGSARIAQGVTAMARPLWSERLPPTRTRRPSPGKGFRGSGLAGGRWHAQTVLRMMYRGGC